MFIIIEGNPVGGFSYVGPFGSHEAAVAYADQGQFDTDWWVVLIEAPAE
jgi:hypothetical protein